MSGREWLLIACASLTLTNVSGEAAAHDPALSKNVAELQRQLAARDAMIADLVTRLERLEGRMSHHPLARRLR